MPGPIFPSLMLLFHLGIKWENDFSSGKSEWSNLNLTNISSKMPGVKFEDQRMVLFLWGTKCKGVYKISTSSSLNKITGYGLKPCRTGVCQEGPRAVSPMMKLVTSEANAIQPRI